MKLLQKLCVEGLQVAMLSQHLPVGQVLLAETAQLPRLFYDLLFNCVVTGHQFQLLLEPYPVACSVIQSCLVGNELISRLRSQEHLCRWRARACFRDQLIILLNKWLWSPDRRRHRDQSKLLALRRSNPAPSV